MRFRGGPRARRKEKEKRKRAHEVIDTISEKFAGGSNERVNQLRRRLDEVDLPLFKAVKMA